jgi:hypothetical protein
MRDFRDAKAMARTLRAALAAKGFKLTSSESLELIAEAFGAADWNTLAAAIRAAAPRPQGSAPPPPPSAGESRPHRLGDPGLRFSKALELTLSRALACANARLHEFATLEHLLLALVDDVDALEVMLACGVDPDALGKSLTGYIDNELKELAIDSDQDAKPTGGFQRVIERAVIHEQSLGRDMVTGAQVLVAIFAERESHAAWFLQEQGMSGDDAVSFNAQRTGTGSGVAAVVRRPRRVVVEKVKRRPRK